MVQGLASKLQGKDVSGNWNLNENECWPLGSIGMVSSIFSAN